MTQPRSTSTPVDALGATIANQSSRLSALENVAHRHDPPLSALVPTGIIVPFAGHTAPDSWLLCFGQTISRTTYSALFAVIGTTYGVGDGSTTFALPDLRGRVVAGLDNMGGTPASRLTSTTITGGGDGLGETGGSQTNTHNHFTLNGYDGGGWYVQTYFDAPRSTVFVVNRGFVATGAGVAAGRFDSTEDETMTVTQPTMVLNYIIKG